MQPTCKQTSARRVAEVKKRIEAWMGKSVFGYNKITLFLTTHNETLFILFNSTHNKLCRRLRMLSTNHQVRLRFAFWHQKEISLWWFHSVSSFLACDKDVNFLILYFKKKLKFNNLMTSKIFFFFFLFN